MEKYLQKSKSPTHDLQEDKNEDEDDSKQPTQSVENKENQNLYSSSSSSYIPLSRVTRPFSFKEYFSHKPSPSSTQRIKFNNSRAKSQFIMGRTAYKLCPRPVRYVFIF